MKAYTLWEPWLSLILDGYKHEETRPKPWLYVGEVALHAAQHVDEAAAKQFGYDPGILRRTTCGRVCAVVEKLASYQFTENNCHKNPYGNYAPGRYGYPFKNIRKLVTPVPAKGNRSPWEWVLPADAVLVPVVPRGVCGRCYAENVLLYPAACAEKPELLKGLPLGMYHCPDCGAMVLAGVEHPTVCEYCLKGGVL